MKRRIRLAHSPDSDDAFMFFALAKGLVDSGEYEFVHELSDIESLNRRARLGELDVTAVSFHAYPEIAAEYILLPHGASFGDGYGPVVVSSRPRTPGDLDGLTVAIPGEKTSAALALQLFRPGTKMRVLPFDEILPAVRDGSADAGILIHEGQLTFREEGLHEIVDLGRWWKDTTGLPLPLGGNAIRRDLGPAVIADVSRLLHASIEYGLDHREEALDYAMTFARGLERGRADRFVSMYVNDWTRDYGEAGRRSLELFLSRGAGLGLVPPVTVEFA